MAANLNTTVICRTILTLVNVGIAVNCRGIFITSAPGVTIFRHLLYRMIEDQPADWREEQLGSKLMELVSILTNFFLPL
jgi:hypothetical protein